MLRTNCRDGDSIHFVYANVINFTLYLTTAWHVVWDIMYFIY